MIFGIAAFFLLGIERFLYGYIYHFPESFRTICSTGFLKPLFDYGDREYWQVAKYLGMIVKVFQFGVVGYDLLIRCSLRIAPFEALVVGLALLACGQLLNIAVFDAIKAKGVYYGTQLGYDVPWCTGFPYNLGIPDPQYWGVVLTVWGVYVCVSSTTCIVDSCYIVPWLETFWYITSMKLLESTDNGEAVLGSLGLKQKKGQ
mmetsp:Transcript_68885/g.165347  ORF Transcript_68885/g.165347 Transcript_68885/m.165347 type:complete len:202 (+) Transcript_68885:110-715(+)|eukprot:CAMPEP_0178436614 /NCGR_PEP_ID=MMETSP0689_2-20121128/34532_1 /TAXON_ID=160604 /ORGANISM="Amphidinium massartii, Strain CS-259" /LENGTH=201 /DNA_ID=CAMNT_0020058719 /DNA_START=114 /DNA_END=719 /DNA_ORIENTATION=+